MLSTPLHCTALLFDVQNKEENGPKHDDDVSFSLVFKSRTVDLGLFFFPFALIKAERVAVCVYVQSL